jgi:hypothetical protein
LEKFQKCSLVILKSFLKEEGMASKNILKIFIATSFNPQTREASCGYFWTFTHDTISEGFHAMSLGPVRDNVMADYKALEMVFSQIKKRMVKDEVSSRRILLQIHTNNMFLVKAFQNLILPPMDNRILRMYRTILKYAKKFRSYEFGWIEKRNNPAVPHLQKWMRSNRGYGYEVPSPREMNKDVESTKLGDFLQDLLEKEYNEANSNVPTVQPDESEEKNFFRDLLQRLEILEEEIHFMKNILHEKIEQV